MILTVQKLKTKTQSQFEKNLISWEEVDRHKLIISNYSISAVNFPFI